MRLTIKQLRAFVAVSQCESFVRAAQTLNLTPGAVSILVRDLEQEVGFPLFDRTTRSVSVSKQGREFLTSAHRALQGIHQAQAAAYDVRVRSQGIVQLAAPAIIASSLVPTLIAAYGTEAPGIRIRPRECQAEDMVGLVEGDHADLAIGPARPTNDRVSAISLQKCVWAAWCLPDHRVHQTARLSWKTLIKEQLIVAGDPSTIFNEAFSKSEAAPEFEPTYAVENMTTALALASAGLGIAIAPTYVTVMAMRMGLRIKQIERPLLYRELSAYVSSRRSPNAALSSFLAFVRQQLVN